MVKDCKVIAEKKKIKFKFNFYFPIKTVNLMRGVFVAREDEFEIYYIEKIFDSIWKFGLNMNDQNIIEKVLKNINVNPKKFFLRTSSQSVKNLLRKRTNEAFDKGIFGAPTFFVNNKIYWGQDRLEYALAEVKK